MASRPNPSPAVATPDGRRPRIALAHDWLCGYRGGEGVLERLAHLVASEYSPASLYAMFDDGRPLAPNIDAMRHVSSILNRLPGGATRLRRWLLPLYPLGVSSLGRRLAADHATERVDLLISTSSAAVKGMRAPEGVGHLCYCHSPARYLWTQSTQYRGGLRGLGLRFVGQRFRAWDRATAANVTRFLANSSHIAREIERCYGREARVVHPPVRTDVFRPDAAIARNDDWLIVSALEPYKRVELAIDAAHHRKARLVIVGTGSMEGQLRARARGAGTIEFRGRVELDDLIDLYRSCRVLLYPQIEDFGITAVEAQACGLPVVARGAGGALDTVGDGQTGALFEDDTVESLLEALDRVPEEPLRCRENALRFSESVFDAAIGEQVRELTGRPGVS